MTTVITPIFQLLKNRLLVDSFVKECTGMDIFKN